MEAVEHLCKNCNSPVAGDAAFCPNCGAAQVYFSERQILPTRIAVTAGSGPTMPLDQAEHVVRRAVDASNWRAKYRSALVAGGLAAVLSMIPIGPAFVFALPLAGFVSVLLYWRHSTSGEPTPGAGFRMGASAGLAGFIILAMLAAVQTTAFHGENELRASLIQAVKQSQERYADPQARQTLEYFMTPDGLIYLMIFGSLFMCVLFVLFAGIGGAMSAVLLARRKE